MGPKSRHHAAEQDLFRMELVNLIDQRHELIKLASLIDWAALEQAWGPKFESAPRHFVLNPTDRMAGRRRARWACGQAAFEPVHMSTGR
jgi:IS5 family transposase